jgi:nucleoprotein TPR
MNYKNSRVNIDEETRNLRVRVQTLESDKRDTLEALDRKCNDYDKLQEEYTAVQHKNIATRREFNALETKLQQAESAQSNAKFRAQSLEQELEMVKKNNEWLDTELATKVKEHQKFRKEKAAQVSSLNSELEEAHSNAEMLRRSVDSLKERYEDVSKKAEERLAKIKDLQSSAATQEESFKQEINSQKRLAELYEKAMHTAKARVAEVEKIMEQELERFNVEIGHANSAVETERADKEEAEKRVAELEVEVERLEGELQAFNSGDYVPQASTSPQGSVNGGMSTPRRPASAMGFRGTPGSPMPFSTPAAGRLEGKGMSVTRLYADFNQMKAKYETEKRRSAKLQAAVEDMMKDMEERAPEIEELRSEHSRMEKDLVDMSKLLEEASKERDQAKKETRRISGKISDYEREVALLRKQLRDLSLQIQVLSVEIERRDAGIQDLNAQQNRIYEEIISGNLRLEDSHDTDALISQRLVVFRTVAELQQQNADLLRAVRELGAKMEQEEQQHVKDKEASDNEEIRRLEGVVERLQSEMKNVILKSQTFVRERDMFRRMLQNKGELTRDGQPPASPAPPASDAGSTVFAEMQQNVAEALRSLQSQYDQFKTESLENQNTINEQNRNLSKRKSELEINVARLNSQLEMASGTAHVPVVEVFAC